MKNIFHFLRRNKMTQLGLSDAQKFYNLVQSCFMNHDITVRSLRSFCSHLKKVDEEIVKLTDINGRISSCSKNVVIGEQLYRESVLEGGFLLALIGIYTRKRTTFKQESLLYGFLVVICKVDTQQYYNPSINWDRLRERFPYLPIDLPKSQDLYYTGSNRVALIWRAFRDELEDLFGKEEIDKLEKRDLNIPTYEIFPQYKTNPYHKEDYNNLSTNLSNLLLFLNRRLGFYPENLYLKMEILKSEYPRMKEWEIMIILRSNKK